jgi:hypothetical protein
MEEIEEVLQSLELIEREQSASDAEIEKLRDSLYALHRGPDYSRSQRYAPPLRPTATSEPVEPAEPAESDEVD